MARKKDLFMYIVFLLFSLICSVQCSKLNVPRVLLPIFNDFSSNFTLEVSDGGCYKWTTSRQDLIQIIPLDFDDVHKCATSVVVITVSKEHSRNTAIVLAEEVETGAVLRCDVIVDVISTLDIVTTTRELFMEEAPEAFEVRAYDNQGNEFSTLEGVEFLWTLENTALRFITFRDSPYETPPSVASFEESGKQGHIVLLEGVKTGSAKISVQLPYEEYTNLQIEVSLMVIANLIIEPSDVYILRGDVVRFRIIQVKHGRLDEIKLSSSQYFLEAEDSNIGKIERNSEYLTGMYVGKTRVYLHDSNVKDDTGLKLPSATVYVTFPDRIHLTLLPHRNWATIVGEQHDIAVELFTSNDHKIHIGEGVQLRTIINDKYFDPSFRSANGSFITGVARQQGSFEIETILESVISATLGRVNLEPKLTASAEMFIFAAINLQPAEVMLPWDPIVRPKYEIPLKATGGDNKFLWSSSNHSIGVVSQNGLVRTMWHGVFDSCASMLRNHHNRQCAKFFILPPSKMEIVEFEMENEIGNPIFLHTALFGERPVPGGGTVLVPFTKCKELPFDVKTSDNNFYYDEKAVIDTPVGISCTTLGVVGLTVGTARVTVQYKRNDINLEQTVTVSTYKPLKIINPESAETVLAVGTSRYVLFSGGPRPWSGRPSEHIVKISSSDSNKVYSEDETHKFISSSSTDTYVVKVVCREIGESLVTLKVFNKPLVQKCTYRENFATVKVICATPQFITIQPEIKVPESTNCPMDLNAERVMVQNNVDTNLIIIAKDSNGRKFDNISSLEFKWALSPSNLATVTNKDGTYEDVNYENNVYFFNQSYQTLVPENQVGLIEVEAIIVGYFRDVLIQNLARSVKKFEPVKGSIALYLVDDTAVTPDRLSIYNHPLNKQILNVKQGSGYNEISVSNPEIADVKYIEGLRQIEVIPKLPGELKITLRDTCLLCAPVNIALSVVYVAAIRVQMPDRVEVGKCIPAVVKFYDEYDNLMPLPKLEYLDIRYTVGDKIVTLKMADPAEENWGIGEVHYVVTGLVLGETKIVFAAGRGPKEILSTPLNVQVFAPLRLSPRNATILVGSVLQFTSEGGPQPDTNMEFSIENEKIGDLSLHGLFHASNIGYSKVTARSVSINPITGKKVTNSKDTVEVNVVSLIGIKLTAPLTRFVEGTTIPVWVSGIPEKLSTLLIGSVQPPFSFSWGTSCNNILTLNGIFRPFGVIDSNFNKVSVRVRGIQPGTCTVTLNVTVPGPAAGGIASGVVLYTASIDMEVIKGLYLSGPPGFTGKTLLMAPYSTVKLNTNKDGFNVLKYSVHGEAQSDGDDKKSVAISRHLISISNSGTITAHGFPGRAMVVITAIDDYGLKQTLSIVVEVKPVHYMLLTPHAEWRVPLEENINKVPIGSQFKLVTSYHDDTGAKFSAAQCNVDFRTSRHDLIQVKRNNDNVSFTAYMLNEGSTVLKVWTDNCYQISDYVQIVVGSASFVRTKTLTSSDVLYLHSSVTDKTGKFGKWSSETEDLLYVNSETGIGQVRSAVANKARLKYDLTPAASIAIDIAPISEILFRYENSVSVTNVQERIHKVHFLFKDALNSNKESNLHSGGRYIKHIISDDITFPFRCLLEFDNSNCTPIEEVFDVVPAFNFDNGLYSCDIIPLRVTNANISTIQSNILIKVISENGVESSVLKIPFLPAIYVPSRELVSDSSYTAILTITGLPQVLREITVVPVDDKLVEVGRMKQTTDTSVVYHLNIIDYHWKLQELHDPMSVNIFSKKTNQNIKVQIVLDSNEASPVCSIRQMGSPFGNFVYDNKQTFIIMSSMLVLLFVSFYAYSHYMQPIINVNVASGSILKNEKIVDEREFSPHEMMPFSPCNPLSFVAHTAFKCQAPKTHKSAPLVLQEFAPFKNNTLIPFDNSITQNSAERDFNYCSELNALYERDYTTTLNVNSTHDSALTPNYDSEPDINSYPGQTQTFSNYAENEYSTHDTQNSSNSNCAVLNAQDAACYKHSYPAVSSVVQELPVLPDCSLLNRCDTFNKDNTALSTQGSSAQNAQESGAPYAYESAALNSCECATPEKHKFESAAIMALCGEIGSLAARAMMLPSPQQQSVLNTSSTRLLNFNSSPGLNNKSFNSSSASTPTMRYGTDGLHHRSPTGNSPELRRNRRFL